MKEGFICMLTLFLFQTKIQAQDNVTSPLIRHYYTQAMNDFIKSKDGNAGKESRKLEGDVYNAKSYLKTDRIEIPVVFHILYASGQEYPSESQIWWQLQSLNIDFSATDYRLDHRSDTLEKFSEKLADTEINFCIPRSISVGKNSVPGLIYKEVEKRGWGPSWDMCFSKMGGDDAIDPDKYLNIWVVDLQDSISGWATYPWVHNWSKRNSAQDYEEGIVIDFDFFGQNAHEGGVAKTPFDEGKTLTHLVGNYLGLFDLWSETAICADDYVDDTPIHNAANTGCEVYKHVSTCHEQPAEMIMNFMDNSDDLCQRMFTRGQKDRMQSMFAPGGPRASLMAKETICETENFSSPMSTRHTTEKSEIETSILKLEVWPNPVKLEATLDFQMMGGAIPSGMIEILIYNAQGQFQTRITDNFSSPRMQKSIEVDEWPSGLYFAIVYTQAGKAISTFAIQK